MPPGGGQRDGGQPLLPVQGMELADAEAGPAQPGAQQAVAPRAPVARPMRRRRQFRALMWKNTVLKRREWSATCCPWCPFAACCELALPLAVLALLWWAKIECTNGGQCQLPVLSGWGGRMPHGNFATNCTEGLPMKSATTGEQLGFSKCYAWTHYFMRPLPFLDVASYLYWSGKRIAFAVEDSADVEKVERLRHWIADNWYSAIQLKDIPCLDLEQDVIADLQRRMRHEGPEPPENPLRCAKHFVNPGTLPSFLNLTQPEIYTAKGLQSYLDSPRYGADGQLYAAVVFASVGGDGSPGASGRWAYSIRMNVSARTSPYTGLPKTRPLDLGLKVGEANTYLSKGFMSIQLLLDRYIIGNRSSLGNATDLLQQNNFSTRLLGESNATLERLAEPLRWAPQAVETVPMPTAGVVINGFYQLVAVAFPLIFIVGFLYTHKKVVNELITEKESKVRESLRMMGVTSSSIISSWYVTYGAIFALLCLIFAVVAGVAVFPESSTSVIFAFFWLWCMSSLGFAWFMHCFFNNSRTGGIVTMIIMCCQWIVYASQTKEGPAPENVLLLMLPLPHAAFSAGLSMLAKFEAAKVGATWSNLDWPVDNSCFAVVLAMMAFDVFLWTCLGWYLDHVLPKDYGVRRPFYFPCLPSFWLNRPVQALGSSVIPSQDPANLEDHAPPARCVGDNTVEAVPESVRARSEASGIQVRTMGLRKEFSTPGGPKVAVSRLDLTMYEGQVLALLGHNGAGKSTTIHMLTGMVAPSAGDALVAGLSVRARMPEVRRLIGVCPQHDVLWMELTVWEHLAIYALLRGITDEEMERCVTEMLEHVGLTEKARTRAGSLSGGQKRKLSLCLALTGQPSVLFLDEPTSGMDPYSRRSTWNIVRGARDSRVTVLTTHFMDEADILGDRIAIMASGELQCCGSALFLKNRFGIGYRITCVKSRVEALARQISGERAARVVDVVSKHVPEAELLTDVGAELSIRLPTSASGRFRDLFLELDSTKEQLGLEQYGLSMVTLEEVFLCVASGDMSKLDGSPAPQGGHSAAASTRQQPPAAAAAAAGAEPAPAAQPASGEAGSRREGQEGRRKTVLVHLDHVGALFMKRARYGRRDFKSLACTVLLPVALLVFGLWILQRLSDRHLPDVPLNVAEQFGHTIGLPYNFTDELPWSRTPFRSKDVEPAVESVPEGHDSGAIFGRNYSDGLPLVQLCEDHTYTGSKCWRQGMFCDGALSAELQMVQELEIGIGCNTDKRGCIAALDSACKDDAKACVDICIRKAANVPRSLCRQQCEQVCGEKGALQQQCNLLLPFTTISWFCPELCSNASNPFTCKPGTTCKSPVDIHAADPSGLLNFELLLFKQGQGRGRLQTRYGAVLADVSEPIGVRTTLLYNTTSLHAVPTFLNLVTRSLKQALNGTGADISITNSPLPLAQNEQLNHVVSAVVNLMSTFVIIIAFSWIPAAIVAYIVREREAHHNSKHQQLISGVSLIAYWVANLLWDLVVYLVPAGLSIFFIWAFDISVFIKHGALWASFVTFLGYGVSIAPFSYLLSFLFSKHTTAQVLSLVINFITGLLLMITSYILSAIESTRQVNESLMWVYRFFPGFCLGHGLFEICTTSVAADQGGAMGVDIKYNLLDWDIAGKDVLYLYIAGPCYFLLTVLVDYAIHSPAAVAAEYLDPRVEAAAGVRVEEEDPDVASEIARVASGSADNDIVRLVDLRKVYRTPEGRPKVAVHGLTFGLPRGECFGFLGINGAGKTSTLNMLTGVVLPSSGKAFVGGFDVVTQQWRVRRLLGYCPQHDALLDRLTVREHLELFGRVKGLARAELRRYCSAMMKDLSLDEHVDKMAMTLSGGNKRKLSLAISLMGAPSLALLDEPSTGVDPAARRLMWDAISASTAMHDCSVVLTTHNMEEAEALCTRIGIMVGGRLRCLGSNQHLKARFGDGYQLEVRLQCPDAAAVRSALDAWQLNKPVPEEALEELCAKLGKAERAGFVRDGSEEGHLIKEVMAREGAVPAELFAEWWLLEDRATGLAEFLQQKFPGTSALERHERTLRYNLPRTSTLADIFGHLEQNRQRLFLEEYGICQTSLEQIFNNFAAQQQEETAAVRGLFATGRTIQAAAPAVEAAPVGAAGANPS